MASPKEESQARQMLLGKNLMPYLNKSDTRTVNNAYHHWQGIKKKKGAENKKFLKEGAEQVLHSKHLDIDYNTSKRKMGDIFSPLILTGRDGQHA
jgi:hypothetical protein